MFLNQIQIEFDFTRLQVKLRAQKIGLVEVNLSSSEY